HPEVLEHAGAELPQPLDGEVAHARGGHGRRSRGTRRWTGGGQCDTFYQRRPTALTPTRSRPDVRREGALGGDPGAPARGHPAPRLRRLAPGERAAGAGRVHPTPVRTRATGRR